MHVPRQEIVYMQQGIKRMGLKSYSQYLKTEHWILTRRRLGLKRCEACGTSRGRLALHHMSYINLGAETINDVCTLCDPCHGKAHTAARQTGTLWVPEVSQRRQGLKIAPKVIFALMVACPSCHASPGAGCRTPTGRALGTEHKARRQKSEEANKQKGTSRRKRARRKSARSRKMTEAHAQAIDNARNAEFPLDALRAQLDADMDRAIAND